MITTQDKKKYLSSPKKVPGNVKIHFRGLLLFPFHAECAMLCIKYEIRNGVPMKKKSKQIAAWICIVLLVLLYVATFVIALLDFPGSGTLFQACLVATIGLPILLWIYIWLYGKFKDKHTIASMDILKDEEE